MNLRLLITFSIILAIFIIIDIYLWKAYSKTTKNKAFKFLRWGIPITSLLFFIGVFSLTYRSTQEFYISSSWINFTIGLGVGIVVVKIIAVIPFLLEDITRYSIHFKKLILKRRVSKASFHSRRNFVKNISLSAAFIPLMGTLYAITKGKYNYHNKKLDLSLKRLPKAFEGFKIVHFTDFHAGSFDNYEKVQQGLDLINEEKPDIILFTGDLINNRISEAIPYFELFKNLKAKYGKFAVLGNHDYGDYVPFNSDEEREAHLTQIDEFYRNTGFTLLNNQNVSIEKNGESIDIVGVENWGSGRFPKYGDIKLASQGLDDNSCKILMSHDPEHWEHVIREYPTFYDLTLSGHTHGFQAGVNIPGIKWSPAQYRYKRWLGLYKEDGRYLFVSKGFGFLGFPGRIGMTPEIVTFRLFQNSHSV
ncbi:MAG: metallophosphoesterase [Brumimicrobium sp.]